MDGETLQALVLVIRDGIFSAVFLWLLIREQLSHAETRQSYRQDLRDIAIGKTVQKSTVSENEASN